jgi:hypothetical protein
MDALPEHEYMANVSRTGCGREMSMNPFGISVGIATLAMIALVQSPPVSAQTKGAPKAPPAAAPAEPAPPQPVFAALEIPGLAIASNPNLEVEGIEIAVSTERVTYSYRIRNKASTDIRVAATFALPEFTAPTGEGQVHRVGSAENPIGLTLTADGAPIDAKVEMHAWVLGVDRVQDLKAENIPLVPSGPEAARALMGLSPDTLNRLINLGLVAPPTPDGNPPAPDWSLTIDYVWEQVFPASKTTNLVASFRPIVGTYQLDKDNANDLDEIQDEVCLPAAALRALKTRLRTRGMSSISDLVISTASPMRWLAKPAANLIIDKPTTDTTVAVCADDVKNASPTRVTGTLQDDQTNTIRLLLIGPPK